MKIKLFFSFFFFLSVLGFLFISNGWIPLNTGSAISESIRIETPPPPPSNGRLDKFYIGAINSGADYHCYGCVPYSQLDSLGFNLWHQYLSGKPDPNIQTKWYPFSPFYYEQDNLMAYVKDYYEGINWRVDSIYSHYERKLIMTRPKIEWLCYGQRSDYQCEASSYVNPDLWFYSFQNSVGMSEQDNQYGGGHWVLYCGQPQNGANAGIVISRLKSNNEQCKRNLSTNSGNQWQADSQFDWLIKPRIRIDSAFANNHNNDTVLVCRVDVKNQDDNLIKSIDIRVRNFKPDRDSVYRGNYLEEFYFLYWSDTSSQNRLGDWGDNWLWNARGEHNPDRSTDNHADIQVYWYDNCDMWLDYVRVDNDVAHDLLTDKPTANHLLYVGWLDSEVTKIGLHQVNGEYPILQYYLELCEFNNIPCMAYVNSRIKQISNNNLSLMQVLTPDNMSFLVPWEDRTSIWNADFLYEHYIQKVGFTAIFSECYPFNACSTTNQGSSYQRFSKVPNTLPKYIGDTILAEPVSPTAYDDWLQNNLDTFPSVWEVGGSTLNCNGQIGQPETDMYQRPGQFRNILQICDELSKMSELPIIFMPQAHGWYTPTWETKLPSLVKRRGGDEFIHFFFL